MLVTSRARVGGRVDDEHGCPVARDAVNLAVAGQHAAVPLVRPAQARNQCVVMLAVLVAGSMISQCSELARDKIFGPALAS